MLNYRDYLSYSEKYIQLAEDELADKLKFLIPSILLSWVAIESFANNIMDDFASLPPDLFQLHERSLLLEKKVEFVKHGGDMGKFKLEQTEYKKVEEKILFLIAKFGNLKKPYKGETLWQKFEELRDIRNKILHPRRNLDLELTIEKAYKYLETSKNVIQFVSENVWHKNISF
ncbi:MAG: hypothetical protein ACYS21_00780 [Planctomycetota bacterium]|jgi:hypothetical protein